MYPSRQALIHRLFMTVGFILLACLLKNGFASERYFALDDSALDLTVNRDKNDPRYSLTMKDREIRIENEKLIPFDKLSYAEMGNDIFTSNKEPINSQCYFTSIMMTICWVPVGTEIKKRGNASTTFKTQTGVVMCSDSVAGRGPCMDLQRVQNSVK